MSAGSKFSGKKGVKVPAQVKWLILLTSFSSIGYGYLTTVIAAFLPEQGVDSGQVGLIIGLSGLAMIISAIPFGLMSDRLGRKRLLLAGLALLPFSMFICSFSVDPRLYLAAAIISGVAEGAILSTWNAMIADQTTVDNREMAFSMSFIVNGARPEAAQFAFKDAGGKDRTLADWKGKVVLVNFWATWCPPCVEEIPSLNRLHERLAPRGFEVLAVDVGDTREQIAAFMRERPVSFPVLLDGTGETFKRWKAYAFPTSLLLDRQHRVRYAVYGALAWDGPDVIELIGRLLDER